MLAIRVFFLLRLVWVVQGEGLQRLLEVHHKQQLVDLHHREGRLHREHSNVQHAGRGDGDAFVHRIEIHFGGKLSLKDFAAGFHHLDVRLAVAHYFLGLIEFAMLHGLVPLVKVLSHVWFYPIRVVIARLGPRPSC